MVTSRRPGVTRPPTQTVMTTLSFFLLFSGSLSPQILDATLFSQTSVVVCFPFPPCKREKKLFSAFIFVISPIRPISVFTFGVLQSAAPPPHLRPVKCCYKYFLSVPRGCDFAIALEGNLVCSPPIPYSRFFSITTNFVYNPFHPYSKASQTEINVPQEYSE